jgi:hypothetical protein
VAVVGAAQVEAVGVGELGGVAVGRPDEGHHHRARRDRAPTERHVLAGDARRALDLPIEAQQLLHRGADQRGIAAQPPEPIGMAQQGERAVADQVDGGLVPRDEEQDARGQQLDLAQAVARLLRGDQVRQHVGARRGARR